jgi:hypothetical protein
MKYEKPEVVGLSSACTAVQINIKFRNVVYDVTLRPTIGAYEADE